MEQKPKILEDQECFIRGCEVFKYLEVKIDKEGRQENDIKNRIIEGRTTTAINTFKYHVFAPMGRFQLESIYLYFPPSSQLLHLCFCPVGLSLL